MRPCALVVLFLTYAVAAAAAVEGDEKECIARDYEMEMFIAANANLCTSEELEQVERNLDDVLYQIYPTVPHLVKADTKKCLTDGQRKRLLSPILKHKNEKSLLRRQLETISLEGDLASTMHRRCSYCWGDDGDVIDNRKLGHCRQTWTTLYHSQIMGWEEWDNAKWFEKGQETFLGPFVSGNVFSKAIKLSQEITYIKVDFTILLNTLETDWDRNDALEVSINGQSPIGLRYIKDEDTRFRKNGILSAAEHYFKDDEGDLLYAKVVLHIDLSKPNALDFGNMNQLLLQFKMLTRDAEDVGAVIKSAIIGRMKIKGANACAISSSVETTSAEGESDTSPFEREAEFVLSEKLTRVVSVLSDADETHCLNGKDPLVHVNLYKITEPAGEC